MRRIIKSPSDSSISNNLIIDYINRFWILDVDARLQMFDLKTKYSFQCVPGVTQYNMPLYGVGNYPLFIQPGDQAISPYPVYQGFMDPCFVNGIQVPFYVQRDAFFKVWTPYVQALNPAAVGNGTTSYTLMLPYFPALPGHVDITGILASGSITDPIVGLSLQTNVPLTSLYPGVSLTATGIDNQTMVVTDSGQFLSTNQQIGFLQTSVGSTIQSAGTVNYVTGEVNVVFPVPVAAGTNIQAQSYFFEQGIPRAMLFYNNIITLMPPPDVPYLIETDCYLSPAAFLNTAAAVPFAYMSEYIARGSARKILSDTGDVEQFMFYEPLFREQETLVWKRSQRQFTASRTGTIFSDLGSQNTTNAYGAGSI